MNEADYLYLDREKNRIENELHRVLESGSKADLREAITRIEEYKMLKFGPEEPITVKSVLQDLCYLTQANFIKDEETGEQISMEDYQELVFQNVDMLADLLGIELED